MIVPVKGDDEGLRENLAALASLDYPGLRIDCGGPFGGRYSARRAAGARKGGAGPRQRTRTLGEDVRICSAAVRAARKRSEVLAFADSDGRAGEAAGCAPWWRRWPNRVSARPRAIAGSLPEPPDFWSLMRGVWDAVAAGVLGPGDNRFVWGGAMAIRKEMFFEARVPRVLEGRDQRRLRAGGAVHAAGLTIAYAPGALTPSGEHIDCARFFSWTRRQMAITRVYSPAPVVAGADRARVLLRRDGGFGGAGHSGSTGGRWALAAQFLPGMWKGWRRARRWRQAALPDYEAWFRRIGVGTRGVWVPLATWVWLIALARPHSSGAPSNGAGDRYRAEASRRLV